MSLRRLTLLGLLVALCVALPAGASNTTTYQDSVGEGGADPVFPDITTLVVSNDDTGLITFRVNVPNRATLERDLAFVVFVDTDNNPATGDPELLGADYVIQLLAGEVAMFRWDGTDYTRRVGDPAQTTLVYSYSGGATIKISAAELGNTKQFKFAVLAIGGLVINDVTGDIDSTNAKSDSAPAAGAGFFGYEVKVAPPKLVGKKPTTSPATPRAGKSYTVRMGATRSDTGATIVNGQVQCTARVGGKTLRAKSQRFSRGKAVCVFQIPANASGQVLRGTITIVFEGRKATGKFGGKVR